MLGRHFDIDEESNLFVTIGAISSVVRDVDAN